MEGTGEGCLRKRFIEVGSGARERTQDSCTSRADPRLGESGHPEAVTRVPEVIPKPSAWTQTQGWREVSCRVGHGD